jgi:hypothetical protein
MLNRKVSLVNVSSGKSSHRTSASTGGDGLTCGWEGEADGAGAALTEALADGEPDPVAFDCAPPAPHADATATMNMVANVFVKGTATINGGMAPLVTLRAVG